MISSCARASKEDSTRVRLLQDQEVRFTLTNNSISFNFNLPDEDFFVSYRSYRVSCLQVSSHGYLCAIVWGPEASLTVGWEKKSFMDGRAMIRYKNSHHRIVGKSFVFISSTICTGLFYLVPTTSYVVPILHSFAFKFVSCHL